MRNLAANFWPIYSEYDTALAKLNDQRVANIEDYARNYDQLTDAKANELVQNAFNYRQQRSERVEKYYARVKASLGSIEAARFVQIESQLLDIIDLQIATPSSSRLRRRVPEIGKVLCNVQSHHRLS